MNESDLNWEHFGFPDVTGIPFYLPLAGLGKAMLERFVTALRLSMTYGSPFTGYMQCMLSDEMPVPNPTGSGVIAIPYFSTTRFNYSNITGYGEFIQDSYIFYDYYLKNFINPGKFNSEFLSTLAEGGYLSLNWSNRGELRTAAADNDTEKIISPEIAFPDRRKFTPEFSAEYLRQSYNAVNLLRMTRSFCNQTLGVQFEMTQGAGDTSHDIVAGQEDMHVYYRPDEALANSTETHYTWDQCKQNITGNFECRINRVLQQWFEPGTSHKWYRTYVFYTFISSARVLKPADFPSGCDFYLFFYARPATKRRINNGVFYNDFGMTGNKIQEGWNLLKADSNGFFFQFSSSDFEEFSAPDGDVMPSYGVEAFESVSGWAVQEIHIVVDFNGAFYFKAPSDGNDQ